MDENKILVIKVSKLFQQKSIKMFSLIKKVK